MVNAELTIILINEVDAWLGLIAMVMSFLVHNLFIDLGLILHITHTRPFGVKYKLFINHLASGSSRNRKSLIT